MGVDRLLDRRFEHPEGLIWDPRSGNLLWVDVFRGEVFAYDLEGRKLTCSEVGMPIGSVAPRAGGGLVCAVGDGFGLLGTDGDLRMTSRDLVGSAEAQMNDGGVDPAGRFWASGYALDWAANPGSQSLYRLDVDGTVTEVMGDISIGNGIGWSPDGGRCYFVDSVTRRIDDYAFDVERGTFGPRRTLARTEALPDGLAVDADGGVWVAMFAGSEVHRYTPDGRLDRTLALPGAQVTTCAFGGPSLETLFIAISPYGLESPEPEAGHIFAVDVGVRGLPMAEYAG